MRQPRLRVILVAAFGLALVLPSLASAATDRQHITITPSSAALSIAPGASDSDTMAVVNQGSDSFKVSASVSPYHVEGLDYDPQFTQLPGTTDASRWVQLHVPADTTLAPGKLLNIDYTVRVPAGTQPGGYYAVIFAETTPVGATQGVITHNRVGEILYMTVKGAVKEAGSVTAGGLDHFNTSGSLTIPTLVRNTGGVHFKSAVTVTIKNLFGKQVFEQADNRYVLPQTERRVSFTWTNQVPIGIYHVSRQATTPSGTVHLPDTLVVMIQPWLIVLIIIAIILVVGAILRKVRKPQEPKKKA
jgi:hypothetical protein